MSMPRRLIVRRLGRMDYETAYRLQKEIEQQVKARTQSDTLLLIEHPHTVTLGRRAGSDALCVSKDVLTKRGVQLYESNRGGKATYHGTGQIVGYPIFNLSPEREDVHKFVRDVEQVLIGALADFYIEGYRIAGLTGVHTKQNHVHGKLAAIGIHIARWVTTHGFALNVNTDLSFFNLITACEGEPVAAMNEVLRRDVDLAAVEHAIINRFAEVFEMKIEITEQ